MKSNCTVLNCHGRPMAKYWMHNGLMQASEELGKVGGRHTRPAAGDLAAQEVGKIAHVSLDQNS